MAFIVWFYRSKRKKYFVYIALHTCRLGWRFSTSYIWQKENIVRIYFSTGCRYCEAAKMKNRVINCANIKWVHVCSFYVLHFWQQKYWGEENIYNKWIINESLVTNDISICMGYTLYFNAILFLYITLVYIMVCNEQ